MSERNENMVRLLAVDAPASRDLAFEIALAEAIERRRFQRGLAFNVVLATAIAALLAVLMPALEPSTRADFAAISNIAVAGALFALTVLAQRWLAQRV